MRLASKLTGWQLEIKNRAQQTLSLLSSLEGVGPAIQERLREAGITTVFELASKSLEELTAIKGIGEKTAQKILELAQRAITDAPAVAAPVEVPEVPKAITDTTGEASG